MPLWVLLPGVIIIIIHFFIMTRFFIFILCHATSFICFYLRFHVFLCIHGGYVCFFVFIYYPMALFIYYLFIYYPLCLLCIHLVIHLLCRGVSYFKAYILFLFLFIYHAMSFVVFCFY